MCVCVFSGSGSSIQSLEPPVYLAPGNGRLSLSTSISFPEIPARSPAFTCPLLAPVFPSLTGTPHPPAALVRGMPCGWWREAGLQGCLAPAPARASNLVAPDFTFLLSPSLCLGSCPSSSALGHPPATPCPSPPPQQLHCHHPSLALQEASSVLSSAPESPLPHPLQLPRLSLGSSLPSHHALGGWQP